MRLRLLLTFTLAALAAAPLTAQRGERRRAPDSSTSAQEQAPRRARALRGAEARQRRELARPERVQEESSKQEGRRLGKRLEPREDRQNARHGRLRAQLKDGKAPKDIHPERLRRQMERKGIDPERVRQRLGSEGNRRRRPARGSQEVEGFGRSEHSGHSGRSGRAGHSQRSGSAEQRTQREPVKERGV